MPAPAAGGEAGRGDGADCDQPATAEEAAAHEAFFPRASRVIADMIRHDGPRPPARGFPLDFLWGASTSSHQVEGHNRSNDWWEYEQAGRVPHVSGAACRHYDLFESDFDLAHSWGHNAHRFSLEWSRIEPAEGIWDMDAVAHYRAVIRALGERGLEPVVTLHHFTNPAWFSRRGGWLRRDSARLFARYVEHAATHLGPSVTYWLTINEPTIYVLQGYVNGEWPPGSKAAWTSAVRAFRNLARAHRAAYDVLHRIRRGVMVGFAHSAPVIQPCDPARTRDRLAARLRDLILNRTFFDLVGARPGQPPGRLDFIGINYYTRNIVRSRGWGLGALAGRACDLGHHPHHGPISAMGWEVYPTGLQATLERFSRYGIPLLVTENGIATEDEALRSRFLIQHLESLATALANGVEVIGYLYWSLMDNFEWALGTTARFGLAAVDFATQARRARPCAEDFSRVVREHRRARGRE
jgi:beta-glucosidase